jgi:hypothetical protein
MVVARSEHVRRLRDRLNPRFDAEVVHREICTACDARFPAGGERLRQLLAEATAAPDQPVPEVGAASRDDVTAAQPAPGDEDDPADEAPLQDAEPFVDLESAAPPAPPVEQPPAQRVSAQVAARPVPAPGTARRTPVGAGRRSGPARRSG